MTYRHLRLPLFPLFVITLCGILVPGIVAACGDSSSSSTRKCTPFEGLAPLPSEAEAAIRSELFGEGRSASPDEEEHSQNPTDAETDYTQWRAHGLPSMGAVAQMFMEANYAEGDAYWQGALDWMASRAEVQPEGGVAWYAWENADPEFEKLAKASSAWNAMAFAEGYLRTNDDNYKTMADQAMVWIDAVSVPLSIFGEGYENASGCVFFEEFAHPHFYNLGSYGVTAVGRGAVAVYRATGSVEAENVARCVADAFWELAEDDSTNGMKWGVFMPMLEGYHYPSFCAGTSGIVEYLLEMAITFPEDDRYEQMARGGLQYMASMAELVPDAPRQPAYRWPISEDGPVGQDVYTVITGTGAAGLGRAFLRAYEALGDATYLDYAVGAGNYVLYKGTADPPNATLDWTTEFQHTNWCVGHIGPMNYLGDLYDAANDAEVGLAYLQAAKWLSDQMIETEYGRMFPSVVGGDRNRTDLIWGYTGIVNQYYDSIPTAAYVEPALSMYVDALNWSENAAISEAGGLVWQFEYDLEALAANTPDIVPAVAEVRAVAQPNPSRGGVTIRTPSLAFGSAESSGDATLRLHDIGGRMVRELTRPADSNAGALDWSWDGRNAQGRRVPQGAYFGTVYDGTGRALTLDPVKITILR